MILVSILVSLFVQGGAPAEGPLELSAVQAKAAAAHELLAAQFRSAQRCEPQTITAATNAHRLAIEATRQRQKALSLLEEEGQKRAAGLLPDPADAELRFAVGLLRRDLEASAAMRFSVRPPGREAATPALAAVLGQTARLPDVPKLKAVVAGNSEGGFALPPGTAEELVREENLIDSYFSAFKSELERICLEAPAGRDGQPGAPAIPGKSGPGPAGGND